MGGRSFKGRLEVEKQRSKKKNQGNAIELTIASTKEIVFGTALLQSATS